MARSTDRGQINRAWRDRHERFGGEWQDGWRESQGAERSAVVEMSQDGLAAIGNLAAATSGDLGNVNDPDDEGRILYVETIGEYTQGEQLEAGVYEHVGLETLENAIGKQAVRAFRQWPKDKAEPIMKSVVHNKGQA